MVRRKRAPRRDTQPKRASADEFSGTIDRMYWDGHHPAALVQLSLVLEALAEAMSPRKTRRLEGIEAWGWKKFADRDAAREAALLLRDVIDGKWNKEQRVERELRYLFYAYRRAHRDLKILRPIVWAATRNSDERLKEARVRQSIRSQFEEVFEKAYPRPTRPGQRTDWSLLIGTLDASSRINSNRPWQFPWDEKQLRRVASRFDKSGNRRTDSQLACEITGEIVGFEASTVKRMLPRARRFAEKKSAYKFW